MTVTKETNLPMVAMLAVVATMAQVQVVVATMAQVTAVATIERKIVPQRHH